MKNYVLMHKNQNCGYLSLDDVTGKFERYKDNGLGLSPFLGNATSENMKIWWESRAIPMSRDMIKQLINDLKVVTAEDYLSKNLALSITDTYWIKPIDMDIKYEQVNLFDIKTADKLPYHNATSYDPNASLGGQMEKYWDLNNGKPVLIKEAYKYFGQQSINEVVATKLHERQNSNIAFVKYTAKPLDNGSILSYCDAFTDKDVEFVSAYEVLTSQKISNDINYYNAFIDICAEHGLDKQMVQDFMDYQAMTDFILSNSDEHLANFGILRDANTMKLIAPAPIFDTGNSMFYSDLKKVPYTRAELLERPITSFYKNEEKMLKNVKNKDLVKTDLLPLPNEIAELYKEYGLREDRAELIAQNYANKYIMFEEFQHGKTISLHNEKKNPVVIDIKRYFENKEISLSVKAELQESYNLLLKEVIENGSSQLSDKYEVTLINRNTDYSLNNLQIKNTLTGAIYTWNNNAFVSTNDSLSLEEFGEMIYDYEQSSDQNIEHDIVQEYIEPNDFDICDEL